MDRTIEIENVGYVKPEDFSTFIKMLVKKMRKENENKNKK